MYPAAFLIIALLCACAAMAYLRQGKAAMSAISVVLAVAVFSLVVPLGGLS